MKERHIVYVPGLHDQSPVNRFLSKILPLCWKPYGFTTHVIAPHWEEGDRFVPKLATITQAIDRLSRAGHIIFLIGQSAGGSAVLNAYCKRKNIVKGVVNVSGRLRQGKNVRPTLGVATWQSPAFRQSILQFENQNEPKLTVRDRQKILTIRPLWDEVVPASTVSVKGATNLVAPMVEHCLGGAFICTVYAGTMLRFLSDVVKI